MQAGTTCRFIAGCCLPLWHSTKSQELVLCRLCFAVRALPSVVPPSRAQAFSHELAAVPGFRQPALMCGLSSCLENSDFHFIVAVAQAGEITVPPKQSSSLFYISQRPYLVSGSLRDQLLYPHPPAAVWEAASPAERARFQHFPHAHLAPKELEERLCGALEAVELDYLLGRCG